MKEQVMRNKALERELGRMPYWERITEEKRLNEEKSRAEFEAMLHVMQAQSEGLIGRRNTLKMDEKVNAFIMRYIRSEGQQYKYSLPELLQAQALGQPHLHRLPLPVTTNTKRPNWAARKRLHSTPTLQQVHHRPDQIEPRDFSLWKALPEDIKAEERSRMHAYFFNQTQDRQKAGFNPLPLGSRVLLNSYDRVF